MHKDAKVLIHPECKKEVVDLSDYVGSTKQIIDYVKESNDKKFIIGTEMGIIYQLKKENPNKEFFLLSKGLVCPNMKKTRLESIYKALENMEFQINIDENIRKRAERSLKRMLEIRS
jgi:quinolinate synthase